MKKSLLLLVISFATFIGYGQNNSLDFDGVNDFVQIADHTAFNTLSNLTLEAWIFPKQINIAGSHIIISKENEWQMAIVNGTLQFATRNTLPGWVWVSSDVNIALDRWTHVAVAYNGANYSFYVDGNLVKVVAANGIIDAANNFQDDVLIGKRILMGGAYFTGNLDEINIWNTARTATNVIADMAGNITCPSLGLIASYSFNQGIAYGDNTGIGSIADCTNNHSGIPISLAMNNCTSNLQGGFDPAATGIQLSGNFYPCPDAIEIYNANGFHTAVTWNVTGGTILSSTGCTATVQWGATAGNYFLTASEIGVDTATSDIVIAGDIVMACNDLIYVSVDSICQAIIKPGMVLEGEVLPNEAFQVTIFNPNGSVVPNNIVNKTHVGLVLKYTVQHLCSGNTCWGNIKIEDKWIPKLSCSDTTIITQCGLNTDPEVLGLPLPAGADYIKVSANQFKVSNFDPCDTVTLSYTDAYTKFGCSTSIYAQIIRSWTAQDKYGNTSKCTETIDVERGSVALVQFPPNYDSKRGNPEALDCSGANNKSFIRGWNQLPSGYPSPYPRQIGNITLIGTGYPQGVSCDHIAVTYRDTKIQSCGATYKLLRLWRVFDWCTGELKDTVQLIKVLDQSPPIVSCPGTNGVPADTIGMDYYSCTGTYNVPLPIFNPNPNDNKNVYVLEECSDWTYTVRHLAAINPEDCTPVAGLGVVVPQIGVDPSTGLPLYRVKDMPAGCNWLYYTITDACGYSIDCQFDIYVKDDRQPVAVCDQHTVVSLSEFGEATLYASSVDNGSIDNCNIDSMAVRRMTDPDCKIAGNTQFGSFVTFCCDDIANNPITVVFRVWDKAGNFNDCMVLVEVQDKIDPIITCPSDISIECGTNYTNTSTTGRPTAEDICNSITYSYIDIDSSLNQCGFGWVKRRWRAEDASGRFDLCDQIITIADSNPFGRRDIDWPNQNVRVNGCTLGDGHPDLLPTPDGRPITNIYNKQCANIVSGYEDQVLYNVPSVCIRIIRTWTVIDWCQFDLTNPNSTRGTWKFTQYISINNRVKPVIDPTSCRDLTIDANDNCEGTISIIGEGSDDCTSNQNLKWSYTIDLDKNGIIDIQGQGNVVDLTLPGGTHWFTWYLEDECKNVSSCRFSIYFKETKEPTPYCRTGLITTLMGTSGSVQIWASDFNIGSFDNCTPDSLLEYSFSSDVNDQSRTYTCDSLSKGILDTFSVQMWVTDLNGNQDFCIVQVVIQDNMDVCPDTGGSPLATISGLVQNEKQQTVEGAIVTLLKNHDFLTDYITENEGLYSFGDLDKNIPYEIEVKKDDDYLNGVTTRDLVAIQKHILGIKPLTNTYQLIAADANSSETVSTSDIAVLRKLILGKINRLNDLNSWMIIPNGYSFEDPLDPWANQLPSSIVINSLEKDIENADFMAIKVGDVTGDAVPNRLVQSKVRSEKSFELTLKNQSLKNGKFYNLKFTSDMFTQIEGMQFTIDFDPSALRITGINGVQIELDDNNVGWNYSDQGKLTFSWNDYQGRSIAEDQVLFEIEIEAYSTLALNEVLRINSSVTKAEVYTHNNEPMQVSLRYNGANEMASGFALFQNRPNPFDNSTIIEFELPNEQSATISILDITGKKILVKKIQGQKGINSILISRNQLSVHGILYYQLESGENVSTKKMLLLD